MSQWIFQSDGNYVNFNGGGNLWRLHKDSNCISWHWDESGDLFFDVYDAEFTVKAGNIADVVIDGVPLSAASGFPTAIRAVFTGGGAKVYTALLTQTGTDAPVATVYENTLGEVVWTRNFVGDYVGTSAGLFTVGKTVSPPFVDNSSLLLPLAYNETGGYQVTVQGNVNTIRLFTFADLTTSFTPKEMSTIGGTIFIEIRVYP